MNCNLAYFVFSSLKCDSVAGKRRWKNESHGKREGVTKLSTNLSRIAWYEFTCN